MALSARRRVARSTLPVGVALALLPVLPPAAAAAGDAAASPPTAPVAAETGTTWTWPIVPPVRLIEPFRAPPTPYAAGHRGIDLAAAPGDEARAPADGVVSFAGPVAGRAVLSIDHGAGVVSSIEPVAATVASGQPVAAGQSVGHVSEGGHCDRACVHFGVRVHGEYVSPLLFLGGVPRAVLLPWGR